MNTIKNSTILVIDDEIENLILIEELLGEFCQTIILQTNPVLAIEMLQKKPVDIILLDIMMREIDGYETCQRLKENPNTQAIPVIFLSSLKRTCDKVKGFEVGAVDYIAKPFQVEEMVARIESCLTLHQQLKQKKSHAINLEKIKPYALKERELEVLPLYIDGCSRKDISRQMGLTESTIKWHLANVFKKMDVKNRAQLLAKI